MITDIAVLGLGAMGSRLAERLVDAGYTVTVWNRSRERAEPLIARGARPADDPVVAVGGVDAAILCLTDDDAVRAVCIRQGLIDAVPAGAVVIDTSSVTPGTAREMAELARTRGAWFADAPMAGGVEAAAAGSLTFLCGYDDACHDTVSEVLGHLGQHIAHLGAPGSGQTAKLVNQVLMAGTMLGLAEGLGLASRMGLDLRQLVAALGTGAAASWVLEHRAEYMVGGRYPEAGAVALHMKDLGMVLALAEELDLELPGVRLVLDLEQQLVAGGFGAESFAALGRLYMRDPDVTDIAGNGRMGASGGAVRPSDHDPTLDT